MMMKMKLSGLLVLLTGCLMFTVSAIDSERIVQTAQNIQQKSTLLTYYVDLIDIILQTLENLILNYLLPAYAYVKSNETLRYSLFSLIITVVVMQTLGTFNFIFKRKKQHRLTQNLQDIPGDTQNMQKQIRALREAVSLLKQQVLEEQSSSQQGVGLNQQNAVVSTTALRIDPQIEQRLTKNQQGIEQLKQGLMKIVEIQQDLQESILQSQKEVASDIASLRTGGINSSSSNNIKKNNNNTSSSGQIIQQTAPVDAGNVGGLDSSNQKNSSYSLIEDNQVFQAQQQQQQQQFQQQPQYQEQQQSQQQQSQEQQQFQQPQDARLTSPFSPSPPPQQQQQQSYAPSNINVNSNINSTFPQTSSSVPQQQLPQGQQQLLAPQLAKTDPQQEQEQSISADNTNSNTIFQNNPTNHNSELTFGRPPPPQQQQKKPAAVPFGARSSPALAKRQQQPPRVGGGPFTGPIPPS